VKQDDLLNVGLDLQTGQALTVGEGTYEHWRAKGHSGDKSLVCLYCHQNGRTVPLVICGRVGSSRRDHFRHPPGTAHGGHSPETVWHADGKLLIVRWALHQPGVATAEVEWCTPDHRRRADVLLTMADGTRVAVELQSRLLTDGAWIDRHRDYQQQNIIDVWLWHPLCQLPWILLERCVPVWFLDVAGQAIGIPIGRAHTRPPDWYRVPDPTVFGLHYPPCVNDMINTRWHRLDQVPVDHTGLQLPSALTKELAAGAEQLLASARQMTRSATQPTSGAAGHRGIDADGAAAGGSLPVRRVGVSGEAGAAVQADGVGEHGRGSRLQEARVRRREAERREVNLAALRECQERLTTPAVRAVTSRTGRIPWTLPADFEHAMGVSIIDGSRVAAVVCPVASRITDEIADRLLGVTIYVASDDEQRRIALRCQPAQRIVVLTLGQSHGMDPALRASTH
jgi:hypothetical protein